ncbi:MAG: sulfatase-like hydrolase/transferase [Phycisphaeraceae bacterium]
MVKRFISPLSRCLFAVLLAAFLCLAAPAALRAADRPNIILIMTDDMGIECIGAHGGTSYPTPHLDKLAKEGMRFDMCYAQPLCTPTRVQLMTGLYNVRNYIRFGLLDPKQTTFAQLFKKAGYVTGICGKWQLGGDPGIVKHFGFDESCLWQHTRRPPRYANPGLEYNGVEKDFSSGEYGPDLVNQFAIDFVTRHKDKPFFLYYPMILPHDPYQPTPDSADWDPKAVGEKVNQKVKHFGEMVTYSDKLVGKLDAALAKLGLREKTLLIFIGDNGTGKGASSKMGDRVVPGGKGSSKDNGMHVPMIVSWPGTIKPAGVSNDLIDSTDFLPTICEAAGVKIPDTLKPDGRSFLPQLKGEKGNPREWIYCWYARNGGKEAEQEMAMNHRFKLYTTGAFYDFHKDVNEKNPIDTATLKGEAAAAHKLLSAALQQYKNARPAHLAAGAEATKAGKQGKNKKKNPAEDAD